jgi:hypothetical protein
MVLEVHTEQAAVDSIVVEVQRAVVAVHQIQPVRLSLLVMFCNHF